MKKVLMVGMLLAIMFLSGCVSREAPDFSDFESENSEEIIVVEKESEAARQARIEEEARVLAQKLLEAEREKQKAIEEAKEEAKVTLQETQAKFDEYMSDRGLFRKSFSKDDCKNGLVDMSVRYYRDMPLKFRAVSNEVKSIIDKDLDNSREDLYDLERDFQDVDFSEIVESNWSSDANLINFSVKVSEHFSKIRTELDKVEDDLYNLEDHFKDEKKYYQIERDLDRVIDRSIRKFSTEVENLDKYLRRLEGELRSKGYRNQRDDVLDLKTDLERIDDRMDSAKENLEKIGDRAQILSNNYEAESRVLSEFQVLCR